MITWGDFYKVMCAMIPLYFAMFIAYGSVKWWKIFTPQQCGGINRFVAVFAVPVLSFHFIAQNNPYEMDTKFILADTLSKLLVLGILSLWAIWKNQLDWLITLFSVSTLPNTLVMGIPLLKAMYGDSIDAQSLMVQLVVLQCIIWYTLLLFLFEYRAATILIQNQFPGTTATSITKFEIDNDVISLDGRDPLCTESEMDGNGRIRVRIRRSISSAPDSTLSSSYGLTPRPSNLSNAEIFSVVTPYHANGDPILPFGHGDVALSIRGSPRTISGYASSDVYSLQPGSNFNELDLTTITSYGTSPNWVRSPMAAGNTKYSRQPSPINCHQNGANIGVNKQEPIIDIIEGKDLSFRDCVKFPTGGEEDTIGTNQGMPRAIVMLRLILIVVGRKLSRNPNTYSSIIGLAWSLISFKWNVGMPSIVKYSIKIISDAGLGMAMFSLGIGMLGSVFTLWYLSGT